MIFYFYNEAFKSQFSVTLSNYLSPPWFWYFYFNKLHTITSWGKRVRHNSTTPISIFIADSLSSFSFSKIQLLKSDIFEGNNNKYNFLDQISFREIIINRKNTCKWKHKSPQWKLKKCMTQLSTRSFSIAFLVQCCEIIICYIWKLNSFQVLLKFLEVKKYITL